MVIYSGDVDIVGYVAYHQYMINIIAAIIRHFEDIKENKRETVAGEGG